MSKALVTTQGGKQLPTLPNYLAAAAAVLGSNEMVKSGVGSNFQAVPEIGIRGKVWRLKVDGEEKSLVKVTDDGEEVPIPSLKAVVVAANKGKYKAYFGTKYDPDAEATAPKCYSFDGERPSIYASEPQCKTCAACPKNVFGSEITEQGKKSRACSDNKILAVLPYAAVQNKLPSDHAQAIAYKLKLSATALSRSREDRKNDPSNNTSLLEYIQLLDNFPAGDSTVAVPISAVVTRFYFDKNADYPLVRMKLQDFLTEDEIAYVKSRLDGDDVKAIINEQVPTEPVNKGKDADDEDDDAPAPPPKQKAKAAADEDDDDAPAPPPKQKAKAAAPAEDDEDDDAPAPPPKNKGGRPRKAEQPAAAAAPAVKAREDDDDDGVQTTGAKVDQELASIKNLFG